MNDSQQLKFLFFRPLDYAEVCTAKQQKEAENLICVGYTLDSEHDIAHITVHPVSSKGRELSQIIVAGKHAKGKTFEIVVAHHHVKESVVLGAKYFLLTRERA